MGLLRSAALAFVVVVTGACSSSDGDGDPSSGGSGGSQVGTGATGGKTGGSGGTGGSGAGGAGGGSGGSSAGSGGSGAFPATYGLLEAEWSIIDGKSGQPVACEDMAVDFFRLTLTNYAEGSGWDLDASCFGGRATFGGRPGTWDIRGLLITRDEVALAGLSADGAELTEVRSGETIVFEPFVFEMYVHRLPWTISKAGMPSTCEAVGGSQVRINWLSESALSVVKSCSDGMTDPIPFQGARTLLDAELLDGTGRVLATWELRFWELAGTGTQPPPTIAFDLQ